MLVVVTNLLQKTNVKGNFSKCINFIYLGDIMQFYNFFNMSNFAFPRFDFGGWAMPNFGWNNYSFFNTNFFSPWNNNFSRNYNFNWNNNFGWNNYSQSIGDTFVSTNLTTNTTPASFIFNNAQTASYIPKTTIDYTPSTYFAPTPTPSKPTVASTSTTKKTTYSQTPSLVNYRSLYREEALNTAKKDPNLERLMTTVSEKGNKVVISQASFVNDIPYAKKGAMDVLLAAADKIGQDLTITSALGCKTSPHSGSSTGDSHYNPNNPKIDFGGGLSHDAARSLKKDLESTGLFNFVNIEYDGATAHLDAQIKMSAYDKYA